MQRYAKGEGNTDNYSSAHEVIQQCWLHTPLLHICTIETFRNIPPHRTAACSRHVQPLPWVQVEEWKWRRKPFSTPEVTRGMGMSR
jgi:hypothetical protein